MNDGAVDVEVRLHGTGRVWFRPLTERATEWYFEHCSPDFWGYFHMRRYGDTPFGWYDAQQDAGMVMLIEFLLRAGLVVESINFELAEDDDDFRRRLKLGDYKVTEKQKREWRAEQAEGRGE